MERISWKKGLFQCVYKLFSGSEKVGELKPNRFTLSATGTIGDEQYYFKVREGLCTKVEIIDTHTKETVGNVRFGRWWPKANIELNGESYQWKFSSLFETRWKITDSNQKSLDYKGWTCSGSMQGQLSTHLMSLTGLFISTYYWQMNAIYAALLVFPLSLAIT